MKKITCIHICTLAAIVLNAHYVMAQPASVVAYPEDSKALVQWAKYTNATDYIIEYQAASANTWLTFPDGITTTPGVTVTGLTNNTSYNFRVSAVVNNIPTNTSTLVSAIPATTYNAHISNQILSTGQSLSVGWTTSPTLTTTQPYANKMLNHAYTALIPLREPATDASDQVDVVESMSSAMANMLSCLTAGTNTQVNSIVSLNGVGGAPYSTLKKGTPPYADGITCINKARDLTNVSLLPYRVNAITTIHGEADEGNGVSAATYAGYLVQWQNDYQTDAKAITGQDGIIPLFTDQVSSWTTYNHTQPTTAIGQWHAARENPAKIYLATPIYFLDYIGDGQHLENYSYRRMGEYFGKVMKKVLVDKQPWLPLSPNCISISGNVITARFNVPVPPVKFNTTAVMLKANYGFEYFDNTNSATITNVAITGPSTVKITLSKVPTGANKMLAYAFTGVSGSGAGRNVAGAPKGNLCDSDNTPALYQDANIPSTMGNILMNWCVTFKEPIINAITNTVTVTACNNYHLNGQSYTQSGVYTQTLTSAGGCDSILTLKLTINSVNASISPNNTVLTATISNATYQWIDCNNNNTLISNQTNQSFTATATGNYAVIVTKNSCRDTSACVHVTSSMGITENSFESAIKVYPNPIRKTITLSVGQQFENASIKLVSVTGQIVIEQEHLNGNIFVFDVSEQENGIYFLDIKQGIKTARVKIIKQ